MTNLALPNFMLYRYKYNSEVGSHGLYTDYDDSGLKKCPWHTENNVKMTPSISQSPEMVRQDFPVLECFQPAKVGVGPSSRIHNRQGLCFLVRDNVVHQNIIVCK